MKTIPLTQGKVALVDDADYEAVNQFKWCAVRMGKRFYAARGVQKSDGRWVRLYLHHFLVPGGFRIDHKDGNSLNYQMENLRPATAQQNAQGFRHKKGGATSRFRGVCWDKNASKWMARIGVDEKDIYLGLFDSEEYAAHIRDAAARKYYGKFAHLNFP